MTIDKNKYGLTADGKSVDIYTLKNSNGIEVSIITYGGIITSIKTPNKKGVIENIVLGYDSLQDYIKDKSYLGAIIGPYANRIAKSQFTLDGNLYNLEKNDGPNNLHSGPNGFDKVLWNASTRINKNNLSLVLNYLSKDMEQGFPGNLNTTVTYTLNNNNCLDIIYEATTDKKTVVNLTNHSYFNLSGNFKNDILDHMVQIHSDAILPVDEFCIPKGEFEKVEHTPFDFRIFKALGKEIDNDNDQLKLGKGYDHCWVLNNQNDDVQLIASAQHTESGRVLEVFTSEPGVQLYTGNHLEGYFEKRTGFCLETQHFPDSPNQHHFPSVVLQPNETYHSKTTFKFSVS